VTVTVFGELEIPAAAVHALGDLAHAAPVIEPAVSESQLWRSARYKNRGE
jgi:hypothetical protein